MLRFAGIQMMSGTDKAENLLHATELVSKAAEAGARLVSLPECFNSPYSTELFHQYAETIPDGETTLHLKNLARKKEIFLIGGTIPELCDGKIYNTCLVFNPDGEIIAKYRKLHLADIDIPGKITFKESDTISPGHEFTVFKVDSFNVGLGICYDLRFPELPHMLRLKGAHVIIYPGLYNPTTGPRVFELLTRARAVDNQVYCCSNSSAVDTTSCYVSWGHSLVVAPTGEVIVAAESDETIIYADMDMKLIEDARAAIPTWTQKRNDMYVVKEVKED